MEVSRAMGRYPPDGLDNKTICTLDNSCGHKPHVSHRKSMYPSTERAPFDARAQCLGLHKSGPTA
eukprot:2031326-Pyramimonas_sp.AAC.1